MRRIIFFLCFIAVILSCFGCAGSSTNQAQSKVTVYKFPDISSDYLGQARSYRKAGRLELARQSYLQALSTSLTNDDTAVIQRELGAIELLIRTMR